MQIKFTITTDGFMLHAAARTKKLILPRRGGEDFEDFYNPAIKDEPKSFKIQFPSKNHHIKNFTKAMEKMSQFSMSIGVDQLDLKMELSPHPDNVMTFKVNEIAKTYIVKILCLVGQTEYKVR